MWLILIISLLPFILARLPEETMTAVFFIYIVRWVHDEPKKPYFFGEKFSNFFSKITYKGNFHSKKRAIDFSHENTPYKWFFENFLPKNAKVRFFGSPCKSVYWHENLCVRWVLSALQKIHLNSAFSARFRWTFFQYCAKMHSEYDRISLFERNSCFRVNIQTF
jgi:hypothetical protein